MLSDEVGNSSVRIGNADDSRRFVKWVMEAREGQVSPVFQDDKQTYLIALAVSDIYDDYRPYDSPRVYPQLQAEALEAKKARQAHGEIQRSRHRPGKLCTVQWRPKSPKAM